MMIETMLQYFTVAVYFFGLAYCDEEHAPVITMGALTTLALLEVSKIF